MRWSWSRASSFALVMTVRCTDSASPREPAREAFSEPYRAARRGARARRQPGRQRHLQQ